MEGKSTVKSNSSSFNDKLYRFIMVVCAALLLHPIAYIVLHQTFSSLTFLSFPISFLSIGAGFVFQAIFSFLTGNIPTLYESRKSLRYEHTGFSVGKALIPIALNISVSIGINILLTKLINSMQESGQLEMYRSYAAYPSYGAALFLALAIAGTALWFVSFEDATDQNMIVAYFIFYFTEYTASFFFGKIPESIIGISALLFFCAFLFLSNKNLLDSRTQTKGVSVISKNAKTVNRSLIIVCIGAVVCVMAIIKTLLSLLKGFIIVFFSGLAAVIFSESNTPQNPDFSTASGSGSGALPIVFADRSLDIIAPILTLLFVIAAIVLAVLYRKKLLEPLLEKIRAIIQAFLDFLKRPYKKKPTAVPTELKSFRDEMSSLYAEDEAGFVMPDEYSSFMRRLSSLNTYNEKLRFSYAVFIRLLRKKDETIKISDTPRNIASKSHNKSFMELKEACDLFELEEYALLHGDEVTREKVLNSLIKLVKIYI